ncbi:hypothetical protein FGO68_gene2815 [Halteria grandinella]|uniref:Uncharacterized protein n=1 Tax=Halteria grandinella TaxID=5974 RepID=A0A8J8NB57_HALGN|nr:hypothetical protein FGO68_gene2815 [Halteria grandinella]
MSIYVIFFQIKIEDWFKNCLMNIIYKKINIQKSAYQNQIQNYFTKSLLFQWTNENLCFIFATVIRRQNNEYRFEKYFHHQAYHQNNDDVLLYA